MTDECEIPELSESAGFLTLSAQLSRGAVDRVVAILQRELKAGRSAAFLLDELKKSLPDYDDHSRALLMQLGAGTQPKDDFPESIIATRVMIKDNTVELKLTRVPGGISLFSLVSHKNGLWLVTEFANSRCVLKQV